MEIAGIGLSMMQAGETRMTRAAERLAAGEIEPEPIVELRVAELEAETGAAVVKVADRTLGTLLDLLA